MKLSKGEEQGKGSDLQNLFIVVNNVQFNKINSNTIEIRIM